MSEKLYIIVGGKKKLARRLWCAICAKELLVRNSVKHSGYCNKCWPKINRGGHGDIESLERRIQKKTPYLKTCKTCGKEQWLKTKPKKENSNCKSCVARTISWKKNGRKHPRLGIRKCRRELQESKTQWANRNKKENKRKLINIFGNECSMCKMSNLPMAVYEFHHVNAEEKEDRISNLLGRRSFDKIMNEAKKCEMVCSNCHKIIHYGDERMKE